MPLKLDVKRKLLSRSDRVKSVDLHPSEPWMLASLYNGNVHIWNYETNSLVRSFEVGDLPVRTSKFVARKSWVVTGSDDMMVKVFNYNTLERLHQFEAHADYLRSIAVHPTQPYILTSSDDMSVKLWDWENNWSCKQVFEGHSHYTMQVVINPKDNNTFATASLDRTIKVWQLGSNVPNFTLEGHEKGVNCVDYYHGGDKPYLISGADDRMVKIWDYQNKNCVATLEGHAQNISAVCFHPELPIILTGSEDSTVRIWHSNTYRLETTLNYGLERVWSIAALKGTNSIAIGYDEGSVVIKLGREDPAVSMDSSGKIIWAHHSEIQQANLKALGSDAEIKDGERLPLSVKDMGACEIYPQTVAHNPNGRFVVVCGDGEYIIYTAMALRNKAYGSALDFVWSSDSNVYAVRESSSTVKVFKNFKELKTLRTNFSAEGIYGGSMLGVRSSQSLSFYEWETLRLIRTIEIMPKEVFWSENGELVSIVSEQAFYILRFQPDVVASAQEGTDDITEDGIENSFDVVGEVQDAVRTGLWVGDCFVYTTTHNRLNYYVGGEIVTIAHLDRIMYLLGYIAKDDRLYLCDKDLNVISYQVLLSVLEYQTAVMRGDFETANGVLPTIPREQWTRVAHFLEKQGYKKQALVVSQDPEHKFDLALSLGELKTAHKLATEADSEEKWKALSHAATDRSDLILAGECLGRARDYASLLLLASCAGSGPMMGKLAAETEKRGDNNVAFMSNFLLGKIDDCLEILITTDRLPEAAFFARTYSPSQVSRVVELWKEKAGKVNPKIAESLADPVKYENLFPGFKESLEAEKYLKHVASMPIPGPNYPTQPKNEERNIIEEAQKAEESGGLPQPPPMIPPTRRAEPPGAELLLDQQLQRPISPVPPYQRAEPALVRFENAPDEDDFEMAPEAPSPRGRAGPPDIASISKAQPDLVPEGGAARQPDVASHSSSEKKEPAPALVQDAQQHHAPRLEPTGAELDLDIDNLNLDVDDDDFNPDDLDLADDEWNLNGD